MESKTRSIQYSKDRYSINFQYDIHPVLNTDITDPTLCFPCETPQVATRETGIEQDEAAVEAVWTRRDRNLHRSLRRGVRRRILGAGDRSGGT